MNSMHEPTSKLFTRRTALICVRDIHCLWRLALRRRPTGVVQERPRAVEHGLDQLHVAEFARSVLPLARPARSDLYWLLLPLANRVSFAVADDLPRWRSRLAGNCSRTRRGSSSITGRTPRRSTTPAIASSIRSVTWLRPLWDSCSRRTLIGRYRSRYSSFSSYGMLYARHDNLTLNVLMLRAIRSTPSRLAAIGIGSDPGLMRRNLNS